MVKRHEAIASLSRDHHQALFRAMRLKRATDDDAEEVIADVVEFWHQHGARHFRVEEEVLLPAYSRYGDPTEAAVVRVLTDHVTLRRRFGELVTGEQPPIADLHELGAVFEDHVRHEERVLFPLIEEALPADELVELGRRIEAAEAGD